MISNKHSSSYKIELLNSRLATSRYEWKATDQVFDYSRFYFVIDGACILTIDGCEYLLSPGEMGLLPAGKPVTQRLTETKHLLKYWCGFRASVDGVSVFDQIRMSYAIKIDDIPTLQDKFHNMVCAENDAPDSEVVRRNSLMTSIFYIYLEKSIESEPGKAGTFHFTNVIKYMKDNIKEDITVTDLAESAFMSPAYFSQVFKETAGVPPIAFFHGLRVEAAKESLEKTNKSIAEIALETGVGDALYFSRFFARHTGVAPQKYRKLFRG